MKHCLVVDDSAVIRKVARRIAEGMGLRVSEAIDGDGALSACRVEMPDAVLLDWNMPGMDGLAFLLELRRLPGGTAPKVVFCTTETGTAHLARIVESGADDYIIKPLDKDLVAAKLRAVGLV